MAKKKSSKHIMLKKEIYNKAIDKKDRKKIYKRKRKKSLTSKNLKNNNNKKKKIINGLERNNLNKISLQNENISIISYNESKNLSKIEDSFYSLDLYSANNDFKFLIDKKNKWLIYFDLNEKKDYNKWLNLNEYASQMLYIKKNEIDILIDLVIILDQKRKTSKFCEHQIPSYYNNQLVAEIWNLTDFDGNKSDAWKKYKIAPQYKRRYTKKFKVTISKNWENIMYCMGFSFKFKNESIWKYLWYLYYLPKRLLILWLVKLTIIEQNDYWWLVLLKQWKSFFFEILRCQNIKNWLDIFLNINDEENKSYIRNIYPLKIDNNFYGKS